MKINRFFIFIAIAVVFCNISSSQSSDVLYRRRNKDGSCVDNNDCYQFEKCEGQQCVDGCRGSLCGTNAWCSITDHSPVCTCWDKHIGDPYTECVKQNCTSNNDCYDYEKCESNKCVDPCASVSCGDNASCRVRYHDAACVCMFGFIGDPLTKCSKKSCTAASDCLYFEKCENGECIDVCGSSPCGVSSICDVKDHSAVCSCGDKYVGDPYAECVRQNCTVNEDCYESEKCTSDKCTPACESNSCGVNAWCTAKDHVALCNCNWGMKGDPLTKCEEKVCTSNNDCRDSEYCDGGKCNQVCEGVLCGSNATCETKNHTAVCSCLDTYTGDPYNGCVRQNCTANQDCRDYEKCESDKCVLACDSSACGENAWCNMEDHVINCTCKPGLTGDPFINCTDKICNTIADCSDSERCENKKCINVCEDFYCGYNLMCKGEDHIPVCTCADKYSGDAHTGCERMNCTVNEDCYDFEKCESHKCTAVCDSKSCGENAWCEVKDHVAVCNCFNGMTGDPLIECKGDLDGYYGAPVPAVQGLSL